MRKIAYRKPMFDDKGQRIYLIKRFPNGNLVVQRESYNFAFTVDEYGFKIQPPSMEPKQMVFNEEPETVEFLSLYPDGNVYKKSCCPVRTSSYGVENLIQIKVTRRGGEIIDKQFC